MAIKTVLREVSEDIVVVDTHTLDELASMVMKKWLEDDRRRCCRRQERFRKKDSPMLRKF